MKWNEGKKTSNKNSIDQQQYTILSLLTMLVMLEKTNHPPTHTQTKHTADSAKGNKREGGNSKRRATSASKNKMLWKPMYMMTNTHVGHHMVATFPHLRTYVPKAQT